LKKFIFFIAIFLYADISDVLLKIKEIENHKKIFLKYPDYNIFTSKVYKIKPKQSIIQIHKPLVKLTLNAIFNNSAKINGKWVKKGDVIYNYKIIKIEYNKVILKKDNKYFVLTMKHPRILR